MLSFLALLVGMEKLHQARVLAYQEHATQTGHVALEGKVGSESM